MKSIKYIILSLMFLFTHPLFASNEGNVLMVEKKDGKTILFYLKNNPEVTFDADKIYINLDDFSITYQDVQKFYFEDEITADVDLTELFNSTDSRIHFIDVNTFRLEGLRSTDKIFVYSVSGVRMSPEITRVDNQATVSLSSLAPGIYTVKFDKHTFKVVKK